MITQKNKRLFLAIPLPEADCKQLSALPEQVPLTHARWTKQNNLHITTYFFGAQPEPMLTTIISDLTELLAQEKTFLLPYRHLSWAPPSQQEKNMLWAEYGATNNFKLLGQMLEKELKKYQKIKQEKTHLELIPHVTLARFKHCDQHEKIILPQLKLPDLELSSLILMESQLLPDGPEYFPLATFTLSCNAA